MAEEGVRCATDVTEDTIREVALPLGFVDVKVCAVDETWSGLKLMIRRRTARRRVTNADGRSQVSETMKTRYFDHIDLRVKDIERAQRFYEQVLPAIGFTAKPATNRRVFHCAPGEGKTEFFGFTEDPNHQPNGTRISFWAERARKWTGWRKW